MKFCARPSRNERAFRFPDALFVLERVERAVAQARVVEVPRELLGEARGLRQDGGRADLHGRGVLRELLEPIGEEFMNPKAVVIFGLLPECCR